MSGYPHLTSAERDAIADPRVAGASLGTIAGELGRAASTISRELRRNALGSGVCRPRIADGSCLLRRRRPAVPERDAPLAGYVVDRLAEGWTTKRIAGRLRCGIGRGLPSRSTETCLGLDLPPRPEGRDTVAHPAARPRPAGSAQAPGLDGQVVGEDPYASVALRA